MDAYWDLFITALIGAVVGGVVDLVIKRVDAAIGKIGWRDLLKRNRLRILLYLIIAVLFSFLTWKLIYPLFERSLFAFDQGTQSWMALSNPADAALSTEWDLNAKALRAEYNFAMTAPGDPNPRATFYQDNFNDTWSGYKTFLLDVTNPNPESLEMSYSVDLIMDGQRCFHEFGPYRNLPPGETVTVSFDLTEPRFKTCNFPDTDNQLLDTAQMINRIYLIVGTNAKPATFKGAILIDNIRLQKDVWFLPITQGLVVLILIVGFAIFEHWRSQSVQNLSESAGKGDPHDGSPA